MVPRKVITPFVGDKIFEPVTIFNLDSEAVNFQYSMLSNSKIDVEPEVRRDFDELLKMRQDSRLLREDPVPTK